MRTVLAAGLLAAVLAGCGDGSGSSQPPVVVTTSILGDVVRNLVGEDVEVEVLMPPGTDPHSFAPSAQQAAALRAAKLVVVNGLGFEAGLLDTIEAAEQDGAHVVAATDAIEVLEHGEGEDRHGEEGPAEDGQGDHGHEDEDADPHFFTDPARMRDATEHIATELGRAIEGLDTPAFERRVDRYLAELAALDAEVEALLADVPGERRKLVTNHEVFGYFADRYRFEVLGAVIPGGSTLAETSAADLDDLARLVAEEEVPAIFAEASSPARLADALAAEGAGVAVVELYTESLGSPGSDGATYVELVRTNAARIAAALG